MQIVTFSSVWRCAIGQRSFDTKHPNSRAWYGSMTALKEHVG